MALSLFGTRNGPRGGAGGLPSVPEDDPSLQWSEFSDPAVSLAASATRAGGRVGMRHVLTGGFIVISANVALGGVADLTIAIRNGPPGDPSAPLAQFTMKLPAAAILPLVIPIPVTNLTGENGKALTVEQTALIVNLKVAIVITGYDIPAVA